MCCSQTFVLASSEIQLLPVVRLGRLDGAEMAESKLLGKLELHMYNALYAKCNTERLLKD